MKTWLITGARTGIGFEMARQLLESGANKVFGLVRDDGALKDLKPLLDKKLEPLFADVTNSEQLAAAASKVESLDVLINNAGIYPDGDVDFSDLDLDAVVAKAFEVNALGPMRVTQAFLPKLLKSKSPVLANITSLMGSIGDNGSGGSYGYRMSKAALNMFTRSFARDHEKVTAICLHPGWVQTKMGGDAAPTKPKESASGLLKVIQGASKKESGRFFDFENDELPW